jgi:hypothetical protein
MGDIFVRTESTAELWQAAVLTTGPVGNCGTSYNPLSITEPLQIATFEVKIRYKGTYLAGAPAGDIAWEWQIVGDPKITKDNNLTPTIKSYYDANKDPNSPVMESGLNTKLQTKLKEDLTKEKEKLIQAKIKDYYNYSNIFHLRQTPGMNELVKIFAAKAGLRYTPSTYAPITLTGKILIFPRMVTTAKETDTAEMEYTSGSGTEKAKSCATAQILVASNISNFVIRLDNVIQNRTDVNFTPYDPIINNFSVLELAELRGRQAAIEIAMGIRRDKQKGLVEEWADAQRDANRRAQWLREWANNQRTTIEPVGKGFFKYGLSSTAPGIFYLGLSVPFGEGGLYFNSATVVLNFNVNRLTAEIAFWDQYGARVRERVNNAKSQMEAYQNSLLNKTPATPTTNVTLDPNAPIDTALPGNPDVGQAPSNSGTGTRDGAITDSADLSPFFPGGFPDWLPFNPVLPDSGIDGFQLF